jgi:hypothetical protein
MNQAQQSLLTRGLAGTRAKILEENGKIYVVIDGKRVEADRNDLFGVNKSNMNEYLERLVAAYDEQMAKNEEKISFLEKMEESIKANIKKVKSAIRGILAQCHVSSIGQIEDASLKSQALGLNAEKWDLTFDRTGVNNKIHTAYTDNFIAACNKGDAVTQLSFNEAVAQRLSFSV